MANKAGVVRIKSGQWDVLTKLAVHCSVRLATPINQSTVLAAILADCLPDISAADAVEQVRSHLHEDDVNIRA